MKSSLIRTRWAAIGAAVAVSLGAGGFGLADATISSGEKPVTITTETERVLDTRTNLGLAGRFADATPRELVVTGPVDVAPSGTETVVPTDAVGVLVNVTVVAPSHNGFLSLRPGGAGGKPETSTVNFQPGGVYPNAATVDLGPGGTVQIWVETSSDSGYAHVLLDIVGYTVDHTHDDRYHTKSQVNTKLAAKADAVDVYTKAQTDAAVAPKADSADVYTKAEVDALLATKLDASKVLWAIVNIDGTLDRGSGAVSGGTQALPGTGIYEVAFNRNITTCAGIGAPADGSASSIAADEVTAVARNLDNTSLFVVTRDSDGSQIDSAYTVVVLCP